MQEFLSYKRIIIKIGSALSIDPNTYEFRDEWLRSLFADIAKLQAQGIEVVLVTSGAIACGCKELGIKRPELSLTDMQAVAAYGQTFLINHLREIAKVNNTKIAQVLITSDDCQSRQRYLHTRNTLKRLLKFGILPVINENDSVVMEEIRFSDNDFLGARVVQLLSADLLIILSDVAGLYDQNPKLHKMAKLIPAVSDFTDDIFALAKENVTNLGTGGMKSKLNAAKIATRSGADTLITSGKVMNPLEAYSSKRQGTVFKAKDSSLSSWKNWLLSLHTMGDIIIDNGAAKALKEGNSLLAVGIKNIKGEFDIGDPVAILDLEGNKIACGLVAFDFQDLNKIKGHNSEEFVQILGGPSKKIVIHADDLVVT